MTDVYHLDSWYTDVQAIAQSNSFDSMTLLCNACVDNNMQKLRKEKKKKQAIIHLFSPYSHESTPHHTHTYPSTSPPPHTHTSTFLTHARPHASTHEKLFQAKARRKLKLNSKFSQGGFTQRSKWSLGLLK